MTDDFENVEDSLQINVVFSVDFVFLSNIYEKKTARNVYDHYT